jgi:DNA polymerase (family 10)
MQNGAVAQMFQEIADYLELSGENSFKTRAYRRAAEAIAELEEPVEELAQNHALDDVEGLGPATLAKTREFLATGKVRVLEQLKERYPAGLLEVMQVPGLGPKKVALLYQERGIDSVAALMSALESGKLEGLAGFGAKTLESLKVGIKRRAELSARLPLPEGTHLAHRLVQALATPEAPVLIAGSLRRGCDTLGNLNFVASCAAPQALIERFVALPGVLEVIERTPVLARVKMHPGIEAELVCSAADCLGTELFFRTGSSAHTEEAQSLAQRSFAEEAELYAAMGAAYIPPELREGQGEWEAARAGTLPQLVEVADLRGELHAHSTWSDGTATIEQMALAAQAHGYEYLAITDHSKALAMTNGLDAQRLREQALEIAQVQERMPGFKLLRGIECDILRDGTLDLDDDVLQELDIVIASVHSAFNLPQDEQTARIVRALSHPAVHMVAHPTGRVLGARAPYDVDIDEVIAAAAWHNKALEINASERLDLKDAHAFAARQSGVLLAVDTDAHSGRMLNNSTYGISVARRAWCTSADILNTRSTEDLLAWLKR